MAVGMRPQKTLVLILAAAALIGCTRIESPNAPQKINLTAEPRYQNAMEAPSSSVDNTVISSIVYVCENSTIKHIYKSETTNLTTFELHEPLLNSRSRIYAISNYHLLQGVESIAIGGSQALIEALSAEHSATPQELIMSAVTDIAKLGDQPINVNVVRNVARFDIVIKGTGIQIHEISVSGLAQRGSVFAGVPPADNAYTAGFEALYPTPLNSDKQGVFYAYELPADNQALIEVKVSYDGVLTNLKIPITQIRRNHLYKIVFSSISSMVTASIDVSGMETGDADDAVTGHIPIKIDLANSTLPTNVELSEDNMRVTLPYVGAEATIALSGDFDKQYIIEGAIDGLVVEPVLGTAYQNSKLKITVPANRRMGGNNPVAIISVGAMGETDPSKFDRIAIVATNFAPFQVVTMAGIDWIPINNISSNPGDYPVLQAGQTMRELYAKNWTKYCSKNIQWGPRPGRGSSGYVWWAAWDNLYWIDQSVSYQLLPSINGGIIGGDACMAWDEQNTFCPKGWRVAEEYEFAKIWPTIGHDFAVNASVSYSTSAGNFTATYEKFGNRGDAYNLVISDGTSELILPIAGWRRNNGIWNGNYTWLGDKIGVSVYYWCRTRDKDKGSMTYSIVDKKSFYASEAHNHWMNVRCVRDTK